MNHTKGEWRLYDSTRHEHSLEIWSDLKLIATVHYGGSDFRDDTEPTANAYLLRAAPDLYRALDKASEWLNDMGCEHDEWARDKDCVVCIVNTALERANPRKGNT